MLVLPLIFVILQPLSTPASPAGESLSTNFTLKSPSALKNTLNPKSPSVATVFIDPIPPLNWFQSVFKTPKLHLATG